MSQPAPTSKIAVDTPNTMTGETNVHEKSEANRTLRSDQAENDGSSQEAGDARHPEQKPEPMKPNMHDPAQFPEGGFTAWFCVAGGFCCAFSSFGWVNAIGVFQEYYEQHLLHGDSPSKIAWILSLETFFMFLGAPVVGRIYDNYGPRWLVAGGTLIHVFGLMMASISRKYYQLLLSQGICSPIGASAILYPAMNTVVSWFLKRRALALGVMVSGSSLGGVVFPIMVQRLLPEVGFGWTMRICAFLILGLQLVAIVGVRSRVPPAKRPFSPMEFVRPFREPAFAAVCTANFFGFLGLFIPFNFITLSAISLGMSVNLSSYLLSILNAGSIVGRIFPGYAADKLGRFNIQIVMTSLSAIINLAIWLPARANAPIIVFAILYGIASGAFVSLAPAIIAQITTDMRTIGTRTGTMFMTVSFAALIGNPIAGALVTDDNGGYADLQIFTGVVIAVAAVLFIFSKSLCKGKLLKKF